LTITGIVQGADGQPLNQAWIDFWQVDDDGAYDSSGYKLRGHQFTDANGRYRLETIMPRAYSILTNRNGASRESGRPAHIHVMIAYYGKETLTTELYFPRVHNTRPYREQEDDDALRLDVKENPDGSKEAVYDFVLPAGDIVQVKPTSDARPTR
jgi:protocatechuate 3,4-dioxygenase beta subunit